jgi:hypothetical protein
MSNRRRDSDPDPWAVRRIDEELESDLGTDVSDEEARRALRGTPSSGVATLLRANWLLVLITFAGAIVVGAIASLAVGSWWLLAAALVVHGLATGAVVATVIRLAGEGDKPDPATVADLEDHGVSDPEARVNAALDRIRGEHGKRH